MTIEGGSDADGYIHLLFYSEEDALLQALDFIQATFDPDAEEDETLSDEDFFVLVFRTGHAFSRDQARVLLRVTNPDEHDLNCW